MTRNGGTLADPGSVSRLFNRKGVVIVPKSQEGNARSPRTTCSRRPSTPAPRTSTTWASRFEVRLRGDRPGRRPHRAAGRRRSTTTPPSVSSCPSMEIPRRQGRRRQGVPPDRRPRGPRRRAERLHQLRRPRRRDGRARRADEDGPELRAPPRVSYAAASATRVSVGPNRCSDGEARSCDARARDRPRPDPLRHGRGRGRGRAAADAGRRQRAPHQRRPSRSPQRLVTIERASTPGSTSTSPTRWPSSGSSPGPTPAPSWAPPRPAASRWSCAARRGLPVALHTPSEVKAAVSGSGRADKAQVGAMVTRILRLDAPPKPADAADALALAITHIWRGGAQARIDAAVAAQAASQPEETDDRVRPRRGRRRHPHQRRPRGRRSRPRADVHARHAGHPAHRHRRPRCRPAWSCARTR